MLSIVFILWAAVAAAAPKADFQAGTARIKITPTQPIWMSGYASRTKPSEGVRSDLFAKALSLEDRRGNRVVIVTTDLIGLPRELTDEVAARAQKKYGLKRAEILFNSSHTHTGPVIWPNLAAMFDLNDAEKQKLADYSRDLAETLFNVIGASLGNRQPGALRFGQGTAAFAANRRQLTSKGMQLGLNREGPVDHSVPVLEVRSADGRRIAVLFGYACHNTTLGGDHYQINGDYAGYAQAEIESRNPGVTAHFLALCGGDQNPQPRGQDAHAREHGAALAKAVGSALGGLLVPVKPPLRSAFQVVSLAFAPHTRDTFEQEANDKNPYRVRRARQMLAQYDRGQPTRSTPYPVQAIRFHKDLTIVALGGEVVVDYALRARRHYPNERLVVAGYSNDVMCYIPSLRVLREGGYEADMSMVYYGQPGKFSEDVEESVFTAIAAVLKRVGAPRPAALR